MLAQSQVLALLLVNVLEQLLVAITIWSEIYLFLYLPA